MEFVFFIPCVTIMSQMNHLLLPHHPMLAFTMYSYTVDGSRVKHQVLLKIGTIQ